MGRAIFIGQDIERRQIGNPLPWFSRDGPIEPTDRLKQRLGPLVRLNQNHRWPAEFLEGEACHERFCRICEASQMDFGSRFAKGLESLLDDGLSGNPTDELRNGRENHAQNCVTRSIIRVVE